MYKFCEDCKYYKVDKVFDDDNYKITIQRCYYPTTEIDLVSGTEIKKFPKTCSIIRRHGPCGPEGKLWEKKDDIN